MTSSSLDKDKSVPGLAVRAGFARVVDILAKTSQAMRCAREAKRLTQLSDQEPFWSRREAGRRQSSTRSEAVSDTDTAEKKKKKKKKRLGR